jgi:hypothetical protein
MTSNPMLRDGAWYQEDADKWYVWDTAKNPPSWQEVVVPLPPPPRSASLLKQSAGSSPVLICLIGIGAVLLALFGTVYWVTSDPKQIAAVLAPVTGVIGAFAGHAAGHAAARGH